MDLALRSVGSKALLHGLLILERGLQVEEVGELVVHRRVVNGHLMQVWQPGVPCFVRDRLSKALTIATEGEAVVVSELVA